MWNDFKNFLLKQNAIALALAVVLGAALNKVVQSIVNDLIMPIVSLATPGGEWEKMKFPSTGPVQFGVGDLMSALLNFIIIGLVAWRISKMIMPPPSPAGKACPFCKSQVDAAATRCPHCTSQLA
jgi:large conductance mechanosensitive channel